MITINGTALPTPSAADNGSPVNWPNLIVNVPTHTQHCSILDMIDQSCLPGVPLNSSLGRGFGPGSTEAGTLARGFTAFAGE